MKITYTGKQQQWMPPQQKKLDAKFAKLGKLLDSKRGEKEAHVFVTSERHLQCAEITVNFYDHPLVGEGSDADLLTAMTAAIEKLEKQIVKHQTKYRDTKRSPAGKSTWEEDESGGTSRPVTAAVEDAGGSEKRVYRVDHHSRRKPMTLEEALMDMEQDRDYVVYRDAETDKVSVLLRRRDGHFDLIEC